MGRNYSEINNCYENVEGSLTIFLTDSDTITTKIQTYLQAYTNIKTLVYHDN